MVELPTEINFQVDLEIDNQKVEVWGRCGIRYDYITAELIFVDGKKFEVWNREEKGYPPEWYVKFHSKLMEALFLRGMEMRKDFVKTHGIS